MVNLDSEASGDEGQGCMVRGVEPETRSGTCPLCNSRSLVLKHPGVRDRLGFVDGQFDFFVCRDCGSVSLDPLPGEQEIGAFYPPAYMVTGPAAGRGLARRLRQLEWRVLYLPVYRAGAKAVVAMTGLRAGRLLEIGCSSGFQLREIANLGVFEAYGLDIDRAAVDFARQELGLAVSLGSLAEAKFPGSHFDVVVLFNVLEHLPDPMAVLAEVNRILKPGGFLAVKTQLIDSVQARLFGHRWVWLHEAPRHVLLASKPGLEQVLANSGMRPVGHRSVPFLENCVSVALSVMPDATDALAFGGGRPLVACLRRLAGTLLAIAAIPLVLVESLLKSSGTMIHVSTKAEARTSWPSLAVASVEAVNAAPDTR